MDFYKKFNSLSRLAQIILLLIPVVNWVVEILVRVSRVLDKKDNESILGCVLGVIIPIWGWVDLVWVLLYNHLCLA